jgi:DNA-binding NarL/FixJ family response regulator
MYQCPEANGPSPGKQNVAEQRVAVVIADASRMTCQLLSNALAESRTHRFRVVGYGSSSREVIACVQRHQPAVALVGAALEDGLLAGYKALPELRKVCPKLRVIICLDTPERDRVIDAFRLGAKGVFCRTDSFAELCRAIETVHQGQIWVNNQQLQYLLDALAASPVLRAVNAHGVNLLSKREEQVVQRVAEGLTNREIAERLELSEHTVKNYLFRIYDKLGISNRAELILYAYGQQHSVFASSTPLKDSQLQTAAA